MTLDNELYCIFRCISQLFYIKNLLPKIVHDLYMDQNMKFFLTSLKLYKNVLKPAFTPYEMIPLKWWWGIQVIDERDTSKPQDLYKMVSLDQLWVIWVNGERDNSKPQDLYKMIPLNWWWRIRVNGERDSSKPQDLYKMVSLS